MNRIGGLALLLLSAIWMPAAAQEASIGKVKNASGAVFAERDGVRRALQPGDNLTQNDTIVTQANSAVGITFADNSMMSLGSDSVLALDRFQFDSTTNEGRFSSRLLKGTLAVKSGKIVQQTPEAMTIGTKAALLGVRGTEFVVRAEESQ
ncbi:FecR family protein [Magnetospirillum sulfuroxidans]|uniref:FecR domain-containing protein n=1 Tax=Magnetospirillum sulfuroxidans TaxID=611300 RepID=A0ABS5I9H9_9PROT|nr:FecR domain-containing protein [Magnetospirillum sulfuroxidans]MBR9971087.1 FecR domain-containing protein [Magnetospirillum sulfuroxidans]